MRRRFLEACFLLAGGCCLLPASSARTAYGQEPAYASLRGRWQAVELVDNGRVIPLEAIPTWIPSGGHIEVIDNTFMFTSSADGQRHARTFEVDASRYPHEISFRAEGRVYAHGIYQLDQGRWVICAADANSVARPTDFSAAPGSRRVLLVMTHAVDPTRAGGMAPPGGSAQPAASATPPGQAAATELVPIQPAAPVATAPLQAAPVSTQAAPATVPVQSAPPAATAVLNLPPPPDLRSPPGSPGKSLTDADLVRMLLGTWKYKDAYGDFFLTLDSNGTFSTYRETATTSAFQQVFVRAPVSSGTWVLNNGTLTFRCTASVQQSRINQQAPYAVHSVSFQELSFVDLRGQLIKAARVR